MSLLDQRTEQLATGLTNLSAEFVDQIDEPAERLDDRDERIIGLKYTAHIDWCARRRLAPLLL